MAVRFLDEVSRRVRSKLQAATPSENVLSRAEWMRSDADNTYAVLRAYYHNNDLYSDVKAALWERGIWHENMAPLRNPAHRVVEFYAAKLWPGTLPEALPIETDNAAIIEPIQQVWAWSNWAAKKQVAARWFAILGDLFIKVVTRPDASRVYFQLVQPDYVTEFSTDERGFLTYCRIDVPQTINGQPRTLTEVWTKDSVRQWVHIHTKTEPISRLGPPQSDTPLSTWGIDFVPIVHAKFQDVGDDRGVGAFTHAIDKIDEANRIATRLHQMLYRHNRPLWALTANASTPEGKPVPPPTLGTAMGDGRYALDMHDDDIFRIGGNASLIPLVPNLNYEASLSVLNAHLIELERDLPEMAYSRLRDFPSNLSGVAVRRLLGDAIDKAEEVRGVAEDALIRADQMALSIAAGIGVEGFADLGSFEDGDFDHRFQKRDILPLSRLELAQEEQMEDSALAIESEWLPVEEILRKKGYTPDEIVDLMAKKDKERQTIGEALLRQFDAGAGAGAGGQP